MSEHIHLSARPSIKKELIPETRMAIFNKKKEKESMAANTWARPEMSVTFKAEIMPGRTREERTFRIKTVRSNGRVQLHDFTGEHREGAFEPINFLRGLVK